MPVTDVSIRSAGQDIEKMPVVPLRHYGRWLAAVALLVVLAGLVTSMVTNPRFKWEIVIQYLMDDAIISGLLMAIWLTIAAMAIGIVLGTAIALMRIAENNVLASVAS